jgi:hypothetical protein
MRAQLIPYNSHGSRVPAATWWHPHIAPSSSFSLESGDTPGSGSNKNDKPKKDKVVSFRLSEQEYERYLSIARSCYEDGVTRSPDIVAFIRIAMECLTQYITSQTQLGSSEEENP